MTERPTGLTKGAGWEIGVSRTVDFPLEEVWDFLTSPEGSAVWLGAGVQRLDEPGREYQTSEGTSGEIRSYHPLDRVRLTWQPPGWAHDSTMQFTVTGTAAGRTMVRFHQERLADAGEREQQRAHWRAVLDALVAALENRAKGVSSELCVTARPRGFKGVVPLAQVVCRIAVLRLVRACGPSLLA
jgi:uncharacterized protein YndB with AHSA1/START domain